MWWRRKSSSSGSSRSRPGCPPAAAPRAGARSRSSAADSRSVCGGRHVSSTRPCDQQQRAGAGVRVVSGSPASSTSEWWAYTSARVVRQAQVALGVRGVVQRPVGDRRAGDRRSGTRPGGAAPPAPASQPPNDQPADRRPGRRSRSGCLPASAASASTWSVRITSASRRCTTFSKRRRHAGRTPVVDGDHREAGVGPPLPLQPRRPGPRAPAGARAAVDVEQHRQPAPGDVAARVEHRRRQPAVGDPLQRRAGARTAASRRASAAGHLPVAAATPSSRRPRGPATRAPIDQRRRRRPRRVCQPGAVVSRRASTPPPPIAVRTRKRCCSLGSPSLASTSRSGEPPPGRAAARPPGARRATAG